jgi:hypothetical protein
MKLLFDRDINKDNVTKKTNIVTKETPKTITLRQMLVEGASKMYKTEYYFPLNNPIIFKSEMMSQYFVTFPTFISDGPEEIFEAILNDFYLLQENEFAVWVFLVPR